MKNKRPLRTYQEKDSSIWHCEDKGQGYPKLKCYRKNEDYSTDCAHFAMSQKWKMGQPMFCGNIQIGVLA